jgi:hypothetical protein
MSVSPPGPPDAGSLLSRSRAGSAAFAAHHAALPWTGRRGVPGIDYAWSKPSIPALKAAGEVFVAQYFSPDESKDLTPARAHDLQAAGIRIVVVYEYGAQDARRGRDGGRRDATAAEAQAKACHVDGIPIYWAIDYDAPPGDQSLLGDYARGWTDVLGMDRGGNAYGGFWPLSRLKAAGLVKRLWGTPAWSGSNWATSGLVPDIMQGSMITIGGVQCDLDAGLTADPGWWPRPKPAATGATWQWLATDGNLSLAGVVRELNRSLPAGSQIRPAQVLRMTVGKNGGQWDAPGTSILGDWVNKVLGDPGTDPHTAIPKGAKLWVLR